MGLHEYIFGVSNKEYNSTIQFYNPLIKLHDVDDEKPHIHLSKITGKTS